MDPLLEDRPSAQSASLLEPPSRELLLQRVRSMLSTIDIYSTSRAKARRLLESELGVSLAERRHELKEVIAQVVQENTLSSDKSELSSSSQNTADDAVYARQIHESEAAKTTRKRAARPKTFSGMDGINIKKRVKSECVDSEHPPKKKRTNAAFNCLHVLSPQLSLVMAETEMSRPDVVKNLWAYIRTNNLQDPADRRFILCDEKLSSLFAGKRRVHMFTMQKDLSAHLKIKKDLV